MEDTNSIAAVPRDTAPTVESRNKKNLALLLIQVGPAFVESIKRLLSRFKRSLRAYETRRIHRVGRIFKFCAFGLHQLLGFLDSLLDASIFSLFQIRELLLRRCCRDRTRRRLRTRCYCRVWLGALRVPRLPLRVVGEGLGVACSVKSEHD